MLQLVQPGQPPGDLAGQVVRREPPLLVPLGFGERGDGIPALGVWLAELAAAAKPPQMLEQQRVRGGDGVLAVGQVGVVQQAGWQLPGDRGQQVVRDQDQVAGREGQRHWVAVTDLVHGDLEERPRAGAGPGHHPDRGVRQLLSRQQLGAQPVEHARRFDDQPAGAGP